MDKLPLDTALLIIDVQEGLDDPAYGARNNPAAETRMAQLLAAWRATGRPVLHVQHLSQRPDSPLHPSRPGVRIKEAVRPLPGEPLVQQRVNNASLAALHGEFATIVETEGLLGRLT